jgi:muramoyltetrapeptide carboxypeptidase
MKLAGCLDDLAGLVLGDFTDCGPIEEIHRIFMNIFEHEDIPIVAGFEFGHGKQNITVPMGIVADLDADNQVLSFHQAATMG